MQSLWLWIFCLQGHYVIKALPGSTLIRLTLLTAGGRSYWQSFPLPAVPGLDRNSRFIVPRGCSDGPAYVFRDTRHLGGVRGPQSKLIFMDGGKIVLFYQEQTAGTPLSTPSHLFVSYKSPFLSCYFRSGFCYGTVKLWVCLPAGMCGISQMLKAVKPGRTARVPGDPTMYASLSYASTPRR